MKMQLPKRGRKLNRLGLILAICVLAITAGGFVYMYWLGEHTKLGKTEDEKKKQQTHRARDTRLDALRAPKEEAPKPERPPPPAREDEQPKEEKQRPERRAPQMPRMSEKQAAEQEAARDAWKLYYKAKLKLEEQRINSLAAGREYLWQEHSGSSGSGASRSTTASGGGNLQQTNTPGGRFASDQDKTAWANRRADYGDRYIGGGRIQMASHWQVMENTDIPMRTVGGIFSGLPIGVKAIVTRNVLCEVPGGPSTDVCIPMGTEGSIDYNTQYEQGECRVQASLRRFIFPDNSSMDLGNIPIGDSVGYAGMKDECHRHLGERLLNAVLFSSINGAFGLGEAALGANQVSTQQVESVAQNELRQNMRISPTIEIRPGYEFIGRPHGDIVFDAPYEPILTAIGEEQ